MHRSKKRLYGNYGRFIVMAIAAFMLILMASSGGWAATQSIVGDPLEIYCDDTGQMALWFYQSGSPVYQYYGENSWGSVIMFDDNATTKKYADPYHQEYDQTGVTVFTGVSNTKPNDWAVDTVMDAGDSGVRVSQNVQYTDSRSYYKMTWTITNQSDKTYQNCKFFHGGDAYFGGDDRSQSYWDANLGMVYMRNPDVSGIMGFYGGLGSPADRYYGGSYYTGCQQAIAGELANTVDPTFVDSGYHLQWNRASLAPGEAWVITAYEKWTEAGDVQVMAPAEQTASGETVDLSFIVQNFQVGSDTFDLTASSGLGWAISFPGGNTVTLAAGESATVTVRVALPAGSNGLTDTVTLTATSHAVPSITNSDSTQVASTNEVVPVVPEDNPTPTHHKDGSWCFISTAEAPAHTTVMLFLMVGICLGLCVLTRRTNG
jgi:hypothetical protein